jgi:integrase
MLGVSEGIVFLVGVANSEQEALLEARREQMAIGTAWVFPSLGDPSQPCKRYIFDPWLRRAYQLAGITKAHGSLWHGLRRKWATERKGYPVSDVAAAGGWRDKQTLLDSYQRADDETIKAVVLNPTMRLAGKQ